MPTAQGRIHERNGKRTKREHGDYDHEVQPGLLSRTTRMRGHGRGSYETGARGVTRLSFGRGPSRRNMATTVQVDSALQSGQYRPARINWPTLLDLKRPIRTPHDGTKHEVSRSQASRMTVRTVSGAAPPGSKLRLGCLPRVAIWYQMCTGVVGSTRSYPDAFGSSRRSARTSETSKSWEW